MADTAARLAILARRNEVLRFTIVVAGIDMTNVAMAMQVRLAAGDPGLPKIQLGTVNTIAAEGLKFDGVTFANGIPTSIIRGRINQSTMSDAAKVPYAAEQGVDSVLAYAMQWTLNGDANTRIEGAFIVRDSAFGSDNAPANRPASYGGGQVVAGGSSGSLTFGDQIIQVLISDTALLAPLLAQVQLDRLATLDAATRAETAAGAAVAAATKVTIANEEGRLLLFVDGSDDQIELGAFLADGTFAPNKWPPLIANLVLRTGTDVDDGSGDLLQILDTSEDGVFLLRITENGLVKGKFDGVDPVAVAAAINGSATALARADAALAKSSAGSRTQLLRAQALTARRNNRFTKSALASPPTIAIAAGGATPAALPRGYTGGSSAFTYLGGVPIGGDSIGVHAVSFPSGGNLGGGRGALHWAAKWCTDASKFAIRVGSDQTSGFFRLWADDRLASDFLQIDAAANGAHLITVDFGTREPRTIRFDCCGNSSFQGLFVGANDTVWSIGQSDIVRAVWAADSFGEGFSSRGGNFPTYTPGLAWPIVAGAHLGWENVRQAAIGGTGYLYDGGAGNGKWNFNAHKADWLTFNPDVLVFAGSVNNGGLDVNAEADQALLTWREARAGLPTVPIIIMGLMTDPAYVTLAATQENLLAARFATFADPNSLFVPIATDPEGPWVKGDGTMAAPNGHGNADLYKGTSVTADRTHLNPPGDLYAGERSAEKIRAWLANR